MSTTLSNGYKKPDAPDPASIWMPDHEDNIQRLNDHNHNGTNSELLDPTVVLQKPTVSVLSGAWSVVSGGYEQTIGAPATISEVNTAFMKFVSTAGIAPVGSVITPTVERVSSTSFKVIVNDNTLEMTVYFS